MKILKTILTVTVIFLATMGLQNRDKIVIEETEPVKDYDGNIYKTVKIGNQVWMAENLKSTHYSDGKEIKYIDYENDSTNSKVYGRLYSWAVATRSIPSNNIDKSKEQGICPNGWHLPDKSEWMQLAAYLGGAEVAGGKLKEKGNVHWINPNNSGTNESGFTALPAGFYDFEKVFGGKGKRAFFSSSTYPDPNDYEVTGIVLKAEEAKINIGGLHPMDAVSVRCIKNN